MPKASIIIATHDRPHLLPRAVGSAFSAGTDIEVVVVDDGSTDETAQVCRSMEGIRYVRVERNQRVAGARNIGLLASRGEYLSFLDDDDTRLAHSLDMQIRSLEAEPQAGLIYGQAFVGEPNCESDQRFYPIKCPQGDIFWKLLRRNLIPCGSAVFRRSCLLRVGLLDDGIPGLDDWDLWVRIAEICPIIAIETPVMVWRRSTPASGQGTSRAAHLVSLCVQQFCNSWINLPRAAGASRRTRRAAWQDFSENMAEHLIWESARALRCGEIMQACKNLATVRRLHPLTIARVVRKKTVQCFQETGPQDFWSGARV